MTNIQLGYCTNVHAGADLRQTEDNLARYAVEVKRRCSPDRPMGVGLWLSAKTARGLLSGARLAEFSAWLSREELLPFTLNGFPYGDFHKEIVKHDVYLPNWFDRRRLEYTQDLIDILHAILPAGLEGSISTLPIAWGDPPPSNDQWRAAAENLRAVAARLTRLEAETGRLIYICLEPEPGCLLMYGDDVVRLFEDHLLGGDDDDCVRRHLRVCHDVCHAAVMFETQRDVLESYRRAGIGVGKVQVSSAVIARLDSLPPADRRPALDQLAAFAEDRYLHQTSIRRAGGKGTFYEDLPPAIEAARSSGGPDGEWRIHFHVPIYLERFGLLETSRPQILDCLSAARELTDCLHYEVETYAWGVLPPELQVADLAEGIAREMQWLAGV